MTGSSFEFIDATQVGDRYTSRIVQHIRIEHDRAPTRPPEQTVFAYESCPCLAVSGRRCGSCRASGCPKYIPHTPIVRNTCCGA